MPSKSTFQRVGRFAKLHSMLDGASGIVVAVSGGADSVAVLDMLVRGLGVGGWRLGLGEELQRGSPGPIPHSPSPIPRLHVAHLDHMLRGRESADDAEFVRALSERLGLPIRIEATDVRAAADAHGRNIEESAREIRYNFLLSVARRERCERIAVGHTMTDQAETFLMRLIRGAGVRGLAAMRPVSTAHDFEEQKGECVRERSLSPAYCQLPTVLLIRPLLCITREEAREYCLERGLEFRTDTTNLDVDQTRNRIRNEILPKLEEINTKVVQSIVRAAENLAGDQDALDAIAVELLNRARWDSSDGVAYSRTAFRDQPPGLRRRMIIKAIELERSAVMGQQPGKTGEVIAAHISAIEGLLDSGSSGKRVAISNGLEVWREFGVLVFKPTTLATSEETHAHISITNPRVETRDFSFSLDRSPGPNALASVMHETQEAKARQGLDWMVIALDGDTLPDELIIRPRQPGERVHVKGRRKTIKLKKLMIDHRIPSSRRATWPIVATADGRYVWSPGLPPADEFAAHHETQNVAVMRASRR